MKLIPYGRQEVTPDDVRAVTRVLRSEYLTQGPEVQKFESAMEKYFGGGHCVAVNSGTAALHLAVDTLQRERPLKKVLTTPISFAASANCILYNGGKVEFSDVDPNTGCLNLDLAIKKIEKNPSRFSGVIYVALGGQTQSLKSISACCKKHGLWLIEDASHSLGGNFSEGNNNRLHFSGANKWIDAGTFSFHPVKHITTGEGGMIWYPKVGAALDSRLLRSHGIVRGKHLKRPWRGDMEKLGFNYRLPDFSAALGISQLKRLNQIVRKRNQLARHYSNELASLPIELPTLDGNAFHLYIIRTAHRDKLLKFLQKKSIGTQVHYPPIYRHTYYQRSHYPVQRYAERFASECLSLPLFPTLSAREQKEIIKRIHQFFASEK